MTEDLSYGVGALLLLARLADPGEFVRAEYHRSLGPKRCWWVSVEFGQWGQGRSGHFPTLAAGVAFSLARTPGAENAPVTPDPELADLLSMAMVAAGPETDLRIYASQQASERVLICPEVPWWGTESRPLDPPAPRLWQVRSRCLSWKVESLDEALRQSMEGRP